MIENTSAGTAPALEQNEVVSYDGFDNPFSQWWDARFRERANCLLPGTDATITGLTPNGRYFKVDDPATGEERQELIEKAHLDQLLPEIVGGVRG